MAAGRGWKIRYSKVQTVIWKFCYCLRVFFFSFAKLSFLCFNTIHWAIFFSMYWMFNLFLLWCINYAQFVSRPHHGHLHIWKSTCRWYLFELFIEDDLKFYLLPRIMKNITMTWIIFLVTILWSQSPPPQESIKLQLKTLLLFCIWLTRNNKQRFLLPKIHNVIS